MDGILDVHAELSGADFQLLAQLRRELRDDLLAIALGRGCGHGSTLLTFMIY
jgi:hypothetical protein